MQKPTKLDYSKAIAHFEALAVRYNGETGKSQLIYENAHKAIKILKAEMKEKYG